jgi:hypothetical protein
MPDALSLANKLDDLQRAILDLGQPVEDTISDLTSLYRALAKPARLDTALTHLELEWLGAVDPPHSSVPFLSRADLMHVLCRSLGIEAVETFTVQDVEDGMGFPFAQVHRFVQDGHVWAYGDPDVRFPRWQFRHGRQGLPIGFISDRLQIVVAAIPKNANPALVRSLMTLSSPVFPRIRERELSPREFLLTGGAPSAVAAYLLRYLEGDSERILEVRNRVNAWP